VWELATAAAVSESLASLGITLALAAPLRGLSARQGVRGALYADFRGARPDVGQRQIDLMQATAALTSIVVELRGRLQNVDEDLRRMRASSPPRSHPSLEQILTPPTMRPLAREVDAALHGEAPILILGESGTGKTVLAQAIAEASGRRPVVRAMLGTTDDLNTTTSELFGHERGAFSGAVARRSGLVELADGGTLILDEVLNLPLRAQQLLLDFTQFSTFRPLGYEGAQPKRVRVRIVAVTNGHLREAVREGRFRADLYYRLAGTELCVPPLRTRREDIPGLAEAHLRRLDPSRDWQISLPLRRLLLSPDLEWRGNVRQLEFLIQRARDRALAADGGATRLTRDHVTPADLDRDSLDVSLGANTEDEPRRQGIAVDPSTLGQAWQHMTEQRTDVEALEREIIATALRKYGGVVARAARELGVPRTSLLSRMHTLGVREPY
jgi:anaerobic nitric oxide reductase transcription regulator